MPFFVLLLSCLGVRLVSPISPWFFFSPHHFLSLSFCSNSCPLPVAPYQSPSELLYSHSHWMGGKQDLAYRVSVAWHSSATESEQSSPLLHKCHGVLVWPICAFWLVKVSEISPGSRLVESVGLSVWSLSPSGFSILPPTLPQWTLTSIQWWAVVSLSVSITCWLESLCEQLLQSPFWKHNRMSLITSATSVCPWVGS